MLRLLRLKEAGIFLMAVIFVYLLIYSDIIDIDFREILVMMNSFILIFLDILFFIKLKSIMQIFNVQ